MPQKVVRIILALVALSGAIFIGGKSVAELAEGISNRASGSPLLTFQFIFFSIALLPAGLLFFSGIKLLKEFHLPSLQWISGGVSLTIFHGILSLIYHLWEAPLGDMTRVIYSASIFLSAFLYYFIIRFLHKLMTRTLPENKDIFAKWVFGLLAFFMWSELSVCSRYIFGDELYRNPSKGLVVMIILIYICNKGYRMACKKFIAPDEENLTIKQSEPNTVGRPS